MLGAVDAVDAKSRVSVDAADLLMVSSLATRPLDLDPHGLIHKIKN